MGSEVKRYRMEIPIIKEDIWALKGSEPMECRIDKKVVDVVLDTDYESLRLSHEETKKQLRALEDAIMIADRMTVYNSPGANEDDIAFIDSLTQDEFAQYKKSMTVQFKTHEQGTKDEQIQLSWP